MPERKQNGAFDWLTKKRVTFRRDVGKERAKLQREADRRDVADLRRSELETKRAEVAERKRKAERKKSDDVDRKIEREMREKGYRNPKRKEKDSDDRRDAPFVDDTDYVRGIRRAGYELLKTAGDAGFTPSGRINGECANTVKDHVSDRAKRYRATQPGCLPNGPKQCKLCGSRSDLMVDHKDGDESNGARGNLRWLCRSCNTREGARMARQGKGRRTVQMNAGAETTAQYARAVAIHGSHYVPAKGKRKGRRVGDHDEGGAIIHDTPKSKRREFAADIWASRKAHGNPGRNPVDAAASLAEAWHGRPASSETDYVERVRFHGVLTDLGRLQQIKVMVTRSKAQAIDFDKQTRLCSSENGKQLYIVGGDQSLDLSALGIEGDEAEKDLVVVGPVYSLVYVTAKDHLGNADKISGPYEHILGEDGGESPTLVYDTMNESLGFAGGSYVIDPTDYDGSHSAGIRN